VGRKWRAGGNWRSNPIATPIKRTDQIVKEKVATSIGSPEEVR
jgi:hypothetical protein